MERRAWMVHSLTIVAGMVEGLLIARLVLRLFAARPNNPAVQVLYAVTWPVVAPFRALDAAQPRYGASLEFATLTVLVILPLLTALAWNVAGRRRVAGRM